MANTLDFKQNKVQVLTLDDLQRTYHENLYDGTPVGGIYHFALIEQVLEMFAGAGLKPEIQEIFAADNRDSKRPGVSVLPAVEEKFGEGAVEAHLLRRVYANIALKASETLDTVTNVCVAYHQRGIQVAIGPMVTICHNQCILNAQDVASNYGKERELLPELLLHVRFWADHFAEENTTRQQLIDQLENCEISMADCFQLVGRLVDLRVRHDSAMDQDYRPDVYPLNNTQINRMAEEIFVRFAENEGADRPQTLWDFYNYCTAELKPDKMDIPAVIPQQLALLKVMGDYLQENV